MLNEKNEKNRKRVIKMAALATPKGSSYVIKKECAKIIIGSKNAPSTDAKIRERAQQFKINNLNKK